MVSNTSKGKNYLFDTQSIGKECNMEMCYDGALVMPNNYAVVSEEEMTYVDGGFYMSADDCATIATYVYFGGFGVTAGLAIAAITNKLEAAGSAIISFLKGLGMTVGNVIGAVIGTIIGVLTVTNAVSFLVGCVTADRKNTGCDMTWYGVKFGGFSYH